jgi:hypothetical protein
MCNSGTESFSKNFVKLYILFKGKSSHNFSLTSLQLSHKVSFTLSELTVHSLLNSVIKFVLFVQRQVALTLDIEGLGIQSKCDILQLNFRINIALLHLSV